MYVVTVDFAIEPERCADFMREMVLNADESQRSEVGCRRFDVLVSEDDATRVFLYEIYDDRAAFDAHLASAHYRRFEATVRGWVREKRVQCFRPVPNETQAQ